MPITVELDIMLARRKMKSKDLASAVGITEADLSLLKQGKVRRVRLANLAAICAALGRRPGDLLRYAAKGSRRSGSVSTPEAVHFKIGERG